MTTPGTRDLVSDVVHAIARAEQVAPEELTPLGDEIDVEALESFLESSHGGGSATFVHGDWRVTVSDTGRITVTGLHGGHGPYVGRCSTCSLEERDVDLQSAQDFFAAHVERGHAVEIVRDEGADVDPGIDGLGSGRKTGTD